MIERVESLSRMVLGAISESSGLSGSRTYASLSKRFGGFSNAPRPRNAATASLLPIFLTAHLPCGPSSLRSIFLAVHLACVLSSSFSFSRGYLPCALFRRALFLGLFFPSSSYRRCPPSGSSSFVLSLPSSSERAFKQTDCGRMPIKNQSPCCILPTAYCLLPPPTQVSRYLRTTPRTTP